MLCLNDSKENLNLKTLKEMVCSTSKRPSSMARALPFAEFKIKSEVHDAHQNGTRAAL